MKKAVCLISGGLDSCVTSFIAKSKGYQIYAISFDYGQIHKKELESTKKIVNLVGAKEHIIFIIDISKFGKSSLLKDSEINIEENKLSDIGKEIPSTYVPARNTIFLSIALSYAESIGADTIFIGANSVDFSGYPDCRPNYFKAFQSLVDIATKKTISGSKIRIETPLIDLSKSEIIKKGLELNAPIQYTWSCYKGNKNACGRCDSCLLRLKGFKDAGLKDPIKYDYYPD